MAIIELEVRRDLFVGLAKMIVAAGPPVPTPTLPVLPDDRLIRKFDWGDVSLGASLAGFAPPPGTLLVSAPLGISHVSIAELRANASATGSTLQATGFILIRATPGQLALELVGLSLADGAVTILPRAIALASNALPIPGTTGVVVAALVLGDASVVLRMGTNPADNLLLPAPNRLQGSSNNWQIRVSGDVFVDQILARLSDGLNPPPAGAVVEDAPSASWTVLPGGGWGVSASAGIEKMDACPTIFGRVDISVDIGIRATFTPNVGAGTIDMRLEVESNASDWDSFRCWAGTGAIGADLLGLFNPLLGIGAAIGSLIFIGEYIGSSAGEEVTKSAGGSLTRVGGDAHSATFTGTVPLPTVPRSANVTASFGSDGVLVSGLLLVLPPDHNVTYTPDPLPAGTWRPNFNCSTRHANYDYELPAIQITDTAEIFGQRFAAVPVTVYLTSAAEPPAQWGIKLPPQKQVRQSVTIETKGAMPGQGGIAFIHSSAGIKRFDLAPPPPLPATTEASLIKLWNTYCDTFHELDTKIEIHEIKWVEPPIDYHVALSTLRHWQVSVRGLQPGESLTVRSAGADAGFEAVTLTADASGHAVLEIVTGDAHDLALVRASRTEGATVSVNQRWLVPLHVAKLAAPARSIVRAGERVGVLAGDRLAMFSATTWAADEVEVGSDAMLMRDGRELVVLRGGENAAGRAAEALPRNVVLRQRSPGWSNGPVGFAPRSVSLPGGRVAALLGDTVVFATPVASILNRSSPENLSAVTRRMQEA